MHKCIPVLILLIIFFAYPCFGEEIVISTTPDPGAIIDDSGCDYTYTFWTLPLSLHLITLGSLLLIFVWKAILLIAHVRENHDSRKLIEKLVEKRPGITINEVVEDLDIKRGTARYHIKRLKEAGKIMLLKNGNYVSIFKQESSLQNDLLCINVDPYLHNLTCKQICRLIYENPGITNKEISSILNLSKPTVSVHIQKIQSQGYIFFEPSGKTKNYFMTEGFHPETMPLYKIIE